ncbi:hypothetical protein HNY73_018152 [Argiope bruennichi]|uniref:Uncharacterized protein n=1 Tax=Argiope bruennichi TaxID=94029 RepID=A0A8T0EGW3_ARGBR|nr:hypothetical protein HNY73_018152 [Argiope bruennichi]
MLTVLKLGLYCRALDWREGWHLVGALALLESVTIRRGWHLVGALALLESVTVRGGWRLVGALALLENVTIRRGWHLIGALALLESVTVRGGWHLIGTLALLESVTVRRSWRLVGALALLESVTVRGGGTCSAGELMGAQNLKGAKKHEKEIKKHEDLLVKAKGCIEDVIHSKPDPPDLIHYPPFLVLRPLLFQVSTNSFYPASTGYLSVKKE